MRTLTPIARGGAWFEVVMHRCRRALIASTGFAAVALASARADAGSIFSDFEYRSFWFDVLPLILMAVVAIVAVWRIRKATRRQAATAPADARRSPRELRLHYLSMLLILVPIIYAALWDDALFLPMCAQLMSQTALLIGLRALGLPFGWRLAGILPAALLSMAVGALVLSWPDLILLPAADQAWALAACAASFAVGTLLAYLSFPPAYRARAW